MGTQPHPTPDTQGCSAGSNGRLWFLLFLTPLQAPPIPIYIPDKKRVTRPTMRVTEIVSRPPDSPFPAAGYRTLFSSFDRGAPPGTLYSRTLRVAVAFATTIRNLATRLVEFYRFVHLISPSLEHRKSKSPKALLNVPWLGTTRGLPSPG